MQKVRVFAFSRTLLHCCQCIVYTLRSCILVYLLFFILIHRVLVQLLFIVVMLNDGTPFLFSYIMEPLIIFQVCTIILIILNNTSDVVDFDSSQLNVYTKHKISMNRIRTLKYLLEGCVCCSACCSVLFAYVSFISFHSNYL